MDKHHAIVTRETVSESVLGNGHTRHRLPPATPASPAVGLGARFPELGVFIVLAVTVMPGDRGQVSRFKKG